MDIEDLFQAMSAERVQRYVEDREEETLFLDFKTVSHSALTNADDRRNLAIAIAGFANSSGGLVVWGVEARKANADAADVAIALKEIDDLGLFVSRVNEFVGTFASPIVDGVRTRGIPTSGMRGFAVTIVPASDSGPHMANAREGRYYKRSGSAFYRMEHHDVADMFGRRRRPVLDLEVRVAERGTARSGGRVEHSNAVSIYIVNRGRGSARNLFSRIRVNKPFWLSNTGPGADGRGGLSRLSDVSAQERMYGGDSQIVVHPGMEQGIAAIAFAYDVGRVELPDLKVSVALAADEFPLSTRELVESGDSILERLRAREA